MTCPICNTALDAAPVVNRVAEIWHEDLGAWFPPDWTPEQCRAWVEAHPEAYRSAHP